MRVNRFFKIGLFSATTILIFTSNLKSQITIGSYSPPVQGALLDLKQNLDGSSDKGLGMPRVKLIKRMATDISTTINGVPAGSYTGDHTGLIVYHIADNDACGSIASGMYVWDGGEWQSLSGDQAAKVFIDARDGEEYKYANFGSAGDWMIENMRARTYAQGGTVPELQNARYSDDFRDKKRWCYPDPTAPPTHDPGTGLDPQYFEANKAMGLFYNRTAALNVTPDGETSVGGEISPLPVSGGEDEGESSEKRIGYQGICPDGWHIPSDYEWNRLEAEIYNNPEKYSTYTESELPFSPQAWNIAWNTNGMPYRGSDNSAGHGIAMMSQCNPLIQGSSIAGKSKPMTQAGFNALPLGLLVCFAGAIIIENNGTRAYFWAGSSFGTLRVVEVGQPKVLKDTQKPYLMASVRCKRN